MVESATTHTAIVQKILAIFRMLFGFIRLLYYTRYEKQKKREIFY